MSWICDKGHEYSIPPTLLIEFNDGKIAIEKICPQCAREFFETNMKLKEKVPVPAKLHGKVTDDNNGQAIEGIEVTLNGYLGITQSDGSYLIEDILPNIEYSLVFSDPLGRYKEVDMTIHFDEGEDAGLDVALVLAHLIIDDAQLLPAAKFGSVAECQDRLVFLWHTPAKHPPYTIYAHVRDSEGVRNFPMPEGTIDLRMRSFITMSDRNTLWWAYYLFRDNYITVSKYAIGYDRISLVDSWQLGQSDSHIAQIITLNSGKVLVAWVNEPEPTNGGYIRKVGFACNNEGSWNLLPYSDIVTGRYYVSVTSALCQHPDGSIWWFACDDGSKVMIAIRLIETEETINVDWVDSEWINPQRTKYHKWNVVRDGELPVPTAVACPSRNSIILVYQRFIDRITDRTCLHNWCRPLFIEVKSNQTFEPLYYMDRYTSMAWPLIVGLTDDKPWLIYGWWPGEGCTCEDIYWGDTYLARGQRFTASSKYAIVELKDENKIQLFPFGAYKCSHLERHIYPMGHNDESGSWKYHEKAYNGWDYDWAYDRVEPDEWSGWLDFTCNPIPCNGVWMKLQYPYSVAEQVDVYYDGSWHNIFDSHIPSSGVIGFWHFFPIESTEIVSACRFRGKASSKGQVRIYGVEFIEVLGGSA